MHAILTSIGTDGDIIPYVGLARVLRKRGHRVTLAVAEPWGKTAREFDLEFVPIVSSEEDRRMTDHPDFWHPLKGPLVIAKWGMEFLERQYAQLADLCTSSDAVLVASCGLLPAMVVSEKLHVPIAHLVLQPWMMKSNIEPPIMPGGLTLPKWAPRPLKTCYWRMINLTGDLLTGKALNRMRHSVDLPPVKCIFEWWLSKQLVIGMFPDWYGRPQSDWIPQARVAGFPMFDGRANSDLPEDVARFLAQGGKPIAITFGTGMLHGGKLFEAAIQACRILGRRGIILSRHPDQLPQNLTDSILITPFAPFQKLFPVCAAIVHHGGIGTTAKALASGVPQLIVPLAFDQMDNATRVRNLGAGAFIKPRHATPENLAAGLRSLMDRMTNLRCEEIAKRFENTDALSLAADWVEELAGTKVLA